MQSVVERYYDVYAATKEQVPELTDGEEMNIYQHHNGLCILCLGPSHPIRAKGMKITKVDFDVGGQDRSQNAVKGKRKKGGIQMHPNSVVCKVTTEEENPAKKQKIQLEEESNTPEDGPAPRVWTIRACVKGSLVEPNLSLVDNCKLLEEKPATDGYFAIIMPHRGQTKTVAQHLPRQSPVVTSVFTE